MLKFESKYILCGIFLTFYELMYRASQIKWCDRLTTIFIFELTRYDLAKLGDGLHESPTVTVGDNKKQNLLKIAA